MTPIGARSISLRLYPHPLDAVAIVETLRRQAQAAEAAGFDGVMVSEHHGGFPGYLPNPLQMCGWLLDATTSIWAAACPLLPLLRSTGLVAEEVAWLAARFPGRVGVGFAAGALPLDFDIAAVSFEGLAPRFREALDQLCRALRGESDGPGASDQALQRCREHPVPVMSAASSPSACRRAAALGAGIILDSMATAERTIELVDAYRGAGGTGRIVLVRRAWVGPRPREQVEAQMDIYRSYSPTGAQAHWSAGDGTISADDPGDVAERLVAIVEHTAVDALNIRLHVAGLEPDDVNRQIAMFGAEVLPRIRAAWAS